MNIWSVNRWEAVAQFWKPTGVELCQIHIIQFRDSLEKEKVRPCVTLRKPLWRQGSCGKRRRKSLWQSWPTKVPESWDFGDGTWDTRRLWRLWAPKMKSLNIFEYPKWINYELNQILNLWLMWLKSHLLKCLNRRKSTVVNLWWFGNIIKSTSAAQRPNNPPVASSMSLSKGELGYLDINPTAPSMSP